MQELAEREYLPLPKAPAVFGISRSRLYRLAAAGQIRLLKLGSRSLVDCESVRRYIATLPPAELNIHSYPPSK